MPNSQSAKKRMRQTISRTVQNKTKRSSMRTVVRKVEEAIEAGDKASAQAILPTAHSAIDRCAKANILHANTAANHKRKLTRRVNSI